LPDGIYKFEAKRDTDIGSPHALAVAESPGQSRWKPIPDGFVENPLGVIPIVPLRNRPRLLCEGESELNSVYRVQNQINGFLFLLALAGYFGAHKQRWAIGLKLMVDDRTGQPVEPFNIAVDKMLYNENPEAKFGEFTAT